MMGRLLMAGLATLLAVVLAEGVLRLGFPEYGPSRQDRSSPFWIHHPDLGWAHTPGTEGRFSSPGSFDVAVRINPCGLRDDPHPAARPDGQRRLLLVGDSFAWAWGVEESEGVAERLEAELAAIGPWTVINLSTAGYSTDQELLWYLAVGTRYEVDLVLLLFCDNDLAGITEATYYDHPKPFFRLDGDDGLVRGNDPVPRRTPWVRLRAWLKGRTYLGKALAILRMQRLPRDETRTPYKIFPLSDAQRTLGRALLTRFAAEVRARGLPFAVVLIPSGAEHAAWLTEVGRDLGVPVLDLGPRFAEALDAGAELILQGDPHWTPAGHALAAGEIAAFLRREVGLPEGAP